jgi:hypothetical protein
VTGAATHSFIVCVAIIVALCVVVRLLLHYFPVPGLIVERLASIAGGCSDRWYD